MALFIFNFLQGTTIYLSMRPAEFGSPADWPEGFRSQKSVDGDLCVANAQDSLLPTVLQTFSQVIISTFLQTKGGGEEFVAGMMVHSTTC